MNTKTLLFVSGLAASLIACRQHSPQPGAEAHDGSSHHAHGATLELNNGKKWTVPPPMMAHIRNVENGVRELETAPAKNHAALAAAIREHLRGLVTNCTMEGKGHDELHKWLMPFLALSEGYFKAAEPRVQEEKYREVQRALVVFNQYFE